MIKENSERVKWSREEIAEMMLEYKKTVEEIISQRQFAEENGVARTTLQHWLDRKESIDHEASVVEFFETPDGLALLHRIVMAAQFVITLVGTGGIRVVCQFLELSSLDRFVASSYGSQQKVSSAIEKETVEYGQKQRAELSVQMKPKQISVTQDETFHPQICLVAIEPVSNFILLEKYSEKRDAESWNLSMKESLLGLPVKILQSTSDEGKGLLSHVKDGLGAHHGPDLFHVQHDLSKATVLALASSQRQADNDHQQAIAKTAKLLEKQNASQNQEGGSATALNFKQQIETAQQVENQAKEALAKTTAEREKAKAAIAAIGTDYHPFDLHSGIARSAQEVSSLLEEHLNVIKRIAIDAELPDRCNKLIDKAKRVVVQLIATIAFFHQMVTAKVEALSLPPIVEDILYKNLIPGFYLQIASRKASTAQQKHDLENIAQRLLAPLVEEGGPLSSLSAADRQLVAEVAKESAQLFQRSSSCVEGRNGQLSLRHHSLHKIRTQKLQALTVVHNYFIKRPDATTAAERFFGNKPVCLFEHLLDHIDLPARPAKKRSLLYAA